MNDHCRWMVSASVFTVCAYSYSPSAATVVVPLFVTSAIGSALVGKILKRILKEERPAGAEDRDPGMPSSHAVSLWSLAIGALTGIHALDGFSSIRRWCGMMISRSTMSSSSSCSYFPTHIPPSSLGDDYWLAVSLSTMVVVGLASYWSYLRVRQGNHTPAQVLVGAAVGLTGGITAFTINYGYYDGSKIGGRVDDPEIVDDVVRIVINGAFLVATWGFAFKYVRKWIGRKKRIAATSPKANKNIH